MKTKTAAAFALVLSLFPASVLALSGDLFYVTKDGKRHFDQEFRKAESPLKACGYILAYAAPDKTVLKASVLQSFDDIDRDPPRIPEKSLSYSTDIKIDAGRAVPGGAVEALKPEKILLSAEWLSRYVNVNEFPSNSIQLGGHFAQAIMNAGITINVVMPDGKKISYPFTPQDFPKELKDQFIACMITIGSQHVDRWEKKHQRDRGCYFLPNLPQCFE